MQEPSDVVLRTAPALRDQVYERLREAILAGELRAGERISPPEIAHRFGISTMPVREAVRLLEQEGLVEIAARRWTRVAPLDRHLVEELVPLFALLEGYALERCTAPTEVQLGALRRHNGAFAAAVAQRDGRAAVEADIAFHDELVRLAGSDVVERALRDARTRIRRLRSEVIDVQTAAESIAQHEQVVAALEAGERAAAADAIRANWERGLTRFRDRTA